MVHCVSNIRLHTQWRDCMVCAIKLHQLDLFCDSGPVAVRLLYRHHDHLCVRQLCPWHTYSLADRNR